ncbi:uncharacterized protein LOC112568058 [Pomacea canaliculata]|uniref:uncharacterized protein LOC112568058 n=1 Tax=Pomacea canaliculata TaxID=400727 RepID=UPI000D7370BD|nr:uncharacterized protein LOC112568058 [Pomacea canaliculata]XP_025100874.1 uncharacterized protein LOC112568058 [Pomacea canaliculata]
MIRRIVYLFIATVLTQQARCDVDKDWMRQTLAEHFSAPRHHVTNPVYKNAAMTFIRDQFREMGLEAHVHTFSTLLPNVTGVNVVGLLKGRYFNTKDDSVAAIAAHYDTMRDTPGVNDNGAAVVAMLQAARELSRQLTRNSTVMFFAFDLEEWEQNVAQIACASLSCGSRALVNQWLSNFFTAPITWKGVLVMDTIFNFDSNQETQTLPPGAEQMFPDVARDVDSDGKRGDFLLITGRDYDARLVTNFNDTWNRLGETQYEIEALVLPIPNPTPEGILFDATFADVVRSDHSSFWTEGYRAVFLTDTANFRGYMTQCYHHQCDNLTYVSDTKIGFIAKTARTLISVVDGMAPAVEGSTNKGGYVHEGCVAIPLALTLLLGGKLLKFE